MVALCSRTQSVFSISMSLVYWNFKLYQISICTMYFSGHAIVWIEVWALTRSFQNYCLLFSKPSLYSLAVCCWLSLHWKINLQPKCRSLTDSNSFSPSIYLYLALCMLVLIPTRFFQKPQGMMLPLPFLMLGCFAPNILLCFRWIDLGLIKPQNSSRRFGVA